MKPDNVITIKPIIVPSNRRKDGTFLVSIRVYFAGKCRRLPTNIVARASDLTRSLHIKSPDLQSKAEAVAARYRDAVAGLTEADLKGKDVDWVVARLNCADVLHSFRLDFLAFAREYVAGKSPGSRGQYVTAINAFERFLGRPSIDVNEITRRTVADFLEWMRVNLVSFANKRLSPSGRARIPNGAESRHIAKLAHIYAKAKERYNDEDEGLVPIPRSPFRNMGPRPPLSKGQDPLPAETVQRIIEARPALASVRTALDLFVLSFGTMGANLADLYEADGEKMGASRVWEYRRRKTRERRADGAAMKVYVPEVIRDRLGALDRLRTMAGKPQYATGKVNKGLARWCRDEGVPVFTFYAARHTWATLARRIGVEKATVDECLAHVGDFPVTDIYAERDWDQINAANARVLSLFRFTD